MGPKLLQASKGQHAVGWIWAQFSEGELQDAAATTAYLQAEVEIL